MNMKLSYPTQLKQLQPPSQFSSFTRLSTCKCSKDTMSPYSAALLTRSTHKHRGLRRLVSGSNPLMVFSFTHRLPASCAKIPMLF